MTTPFGGRFLLEVRDHSRAFIRSIPYNNLQGEWFLNEQGAQIRFNMPYRGLGLTLAQLYAGKHEVWLWDTRVSAFPIFQGSAVQISANSADGSLSVGCSDYLTSYFQKRLLVASEYYTGKPEAAMQDLLTYTNGRRSTGVTASVDTASTNNIAAKFESGDFSTIADLWSQLSDMGDGVDYYIRGDGATPGTPVLHLWGGMKKPTQKPLGLNYPGGSLEGHAYQQVATGLGNYVYIGGTGSGFVNFGSASDATNITAYNAQYEIADGASQDVNTSLNRQASKRLKKTATTVQLTQLVVKSDYFSPFVDFDLGDRFNVTIDDEWVQYNQSSRAVGFQITFGANDEQTTNIYTNTEEEIT